MADTSAMHKRQRIANNCVSINDVPDALLSHVAIYLAKPQQALFAIAVTSSPSTHINYSEWTPSAKSNVIISATSREQWQQLDFGDIEKSLASKLTDDHVRAILRFVDAPNNLKTLKLAGCVNITGSGLDILRDTTLENIDLSLVGRYESPMINPEPQLSENIMIPILDSIIGRGSLKLLQLPWRFRNEPTTEMMQFLRRYEQYLAAFRYKCSKCDILCRETGSQWMYIDDMRGEDFFGMQNYTCYQCLNYYCHDEDCQDQNGHPQLRGCERCDKDYCKNCVPKWKECWECGEDFCSGCSKTIKMKECEGEDCTDQLCDKCTKANTCSYCDRTSCGGGDCITMYECCQTGCTNVICKECDDKYVEQKKCKSCSVDF